MNNTNNQPDLISAENARTISQNNINNLVGSTIEEIDRRIRAAASAGRNAAFYNKTIPIEQKKHVERILTSKNYKFEYHQGDIHDLHDNGYLEIRW